MWKVSVKGETDLPPFPALQIRDQTREEAARGSPCSLSESRSVRTVLPRFRFIFRRLTATCKRSPSSRNAITSSILLYPVGLYFTLRVDELGLSIGDHFGTMARTALKRLSSRRPFVPPLCYVGFGLILHSLCETQARGLPGESKLI